MITKSVASQSIGCKPFSLGKVAPADGERFWPQGLDPVLKIAPPAEG